MAVIPRRSMDTHTARVIKAAALPHVDTDDEVKAECVRIETAFASWLLQHQDDNLTPQLLRRAWHVAWVEGLLSERQHQYERERIARQEVVLDVVTRALPRQ